MQMTVEDNTAGFVVTYNGVVLSASADERATVSVPKPSGSSAQFYLGVQCGYKPFAAPQVRGALCMRAMSRQPAA